ncbi:HEAT repeat domain-containing protein [Kitasatospora sp. NPDC058965]|uniref:HEAT repeat domain-containing protein n=1 Tax=Kitasatospora sp. NPDC058965 TaxID=3346682 RepID=UPI003681AA02
MEYAYDDLNQWEAHRAVATLPVADLLALYPRALRGRNSRMANALSRRLIELREPRAVDLALAALTPPHSPWRYCAVAVLAALGGPEVVPALVTTLPGPGRNDLAGHPDVVVALGRIGGPAAAEGLLPVADWLVRHADHPRRSEFYVERVAWALCRLGTPECVDAALALTGTMRALWNEPTLRALVPVADRRFVPFFLELCAGPQRSVGLAGLERVATKRALAALLCVYRSPDTDRRQHRSATRALASLGSDVYWDLGPSRWRTEGNGARCRRAFAWVLGQAGKAYTSGATRYPEALLGDQDASVRAQAATSLGLIGDPRALHGLLAVLDDPSHRVRARAAGAIARIGADRSSAEPLARVAEGDPVRCVRDAAAAALRTVS